MQSERLRGFTLIELLIAIVIVGLLTTVALPGYFEHTAKARRAEGRNALLMAAQLQERFYSTRVPTTADPIRYALSTGPVNDFPTLYGLPLAAPVYSGENAAVNTGNYTITVNTPDPPGGTCPIASCFVLTATRIPAGKQSTDKCGDLTLSSTGTRGKVGGDPLYTVDRCWGK